MRLKKVLIWSVIAFLVLVFVKKVYANIYCTAPAGGTACGDDACVPEPLDCTPRKRRVCINEDTEHEECWIEENYSQCEGVAQPCTFPGGGTWECCSSAPASPNPSGDGGGGGDDPELSGDPISGTVRLDESVSAVLVGDYCQLAGADGIEPGEGSQVQWAGGVSFDVNTDGTYNTGRITSGTWSVELLPGDADEYRCTCPVGCQYGGVANGATNVDFFVAQFHESWFQVQGGSLHADSGGIVSNIPSTCETDLTCNENLIIRDASNEVGLVSYGSGGIDLGDMGENQIAEGSDDWQAETSFKGPQTGYLYFSRILSEDPEEFGAWDGSEPVATGVFLSDGTTETSGGDWSIASGEIAVILVPGNVTIRNNIEVAEGGFLAIISSGNIVIADEVTNVEGVYIADGVIQTCETGFCGSLVEGGVVADVQLQAEGIFVGWDGIDLRRDFYTDDNNVNPTELFVYRPDLQANAHTYLMRPHYSWAEVKP